MTPKAGGGSYLLVAETMMKPSEEDKNQIIDECSSTDVLKIQFVNKCQTY